LASQLRPITLLNCDYKLLTKMLVARFLRVLPDILVTTQLCSVKGRSIFDGAAAILSAAEALWRKRMPGFLVSLDFFHAYDRVSMAWVDKVLEAMGFGRILREWVATLHKDVMASFMLHSLSPELRILFSIRQGDPLAMILFVIYMEPFLAMLQRSLQGMHVGMVKEVSLGYVDDVSALGNKLEDLVLLDGIISSFEAVSGAILNRSRKSVILGLGTWTGRRDWPVPWLEPCDRVKVLGVVFMPAFQDTLAQSWDRVAKKVEATLALWSSRSLATLAQRKLAIETFAFSQAWYMAQILPMPQEVAARLEKAAATFLWRGRLERLAWQELHGAAHEGGLGLSCVFSRAQSLLANRVCHQLAGGGRPGRHLAYWIGVRLHHAVPELGHLALLPGPHAEIAPPFYADLATLLVEVLAMDCVDAGHPEFARARLVYREMVATTPPPKVEARHPDLPWRIAWSRLATPGLPRPAVDTLFSCLHNILPLQSRRFRLNLAPTAACPTCRAAVEDQVHFFTACPRVADAWGCLATHVARFLGGPVEDRRLLFLSWDLSVADRHVALAVSVFVDWAWETRADPGGLDPGELVARVNALAIRPFLSVFF
jgi:hypothetical protein